jgi:hypothetical protein
MADTPFRDTASTIHRSKDYLTMSVECGRARSHTWWKRLVEYGPWQSRGYGRVGPPDLEALDGIASLFGTTTDQVAAMVAADWYGVHPETNVLTRMLRLSPVLDALDEDDAKLVEAVARRLASDDRQELSAPLSGQVEAAEPAKVEVGGVYVTAAQIDDAIKILQKDMSTAVRQPLKAAGHPLAAMDYHEVSEAHLAKHPELTAAKGSKQQHVGHVKPVILHHLAEQAALLHQDKAQAGST